MAQCNLVPRVFPRRGEDGPILSSAEKNPGNEVGRSSESTRLPPRLLWFDSLIRRNVWVEFVGSFLCTERFSPGTPVSPLL